MSSFGKTPQSERVVETTNHGRSTFTFVEIRSQIETCGGQFRLLVTAGAHLEWTGRFPTAAAAQQRADEIAEGYVESVPARAVYA